MFVIMSKIPGCDKPLYYSGAWAPVVTKKSAKRFPTRESAETRLQGLMAVDFGDGPGKSKWQQYATIESV